MKRLLRVVHEHLGDAIIVLAAVAVLLTIERYRRAAPDVATSLDAAKTTVDVTAKILGMVLGVLGAVVGYRRYFKGRTFAERAKLSLTARPVCWMPIPGSLQEPGEASSAKALLHSVDVEIENIGSSTLWEPDLLLRVRRLEDDGDVAIATKRDGIEEAKSPGGLFGIEPGEVSVTHYRFLVASDEPAFRISAELTTSKKNIWYRSVTVANAFTPEREPHPNEPTTIGQVKS